MALEPVKKKVVKKAVAAAVPAPDVQMEDSGGAAPLSLKKVVKKKAGSGCASCQKADVKKLMKKMTSLTVDDSVLVKKKIVKKKTASAVKRKPTPPETDPLCKFYTSLLQQNPNSEMARKWCLEHGLSA